MDVTNCGEVEPMSFKFLKTSIENLILIEPPCYLDERGYFIKEFEKETFAENGIDIDLFETFESMSKKGTLRGLHFQSDDPQGKLIRVSRGEAYDVAVDIRSGSGTFGHWAGFYLSGGNKRMLYIPPGFAHGFLALEEETIVTYKCTNKYSQQHDCGILWNDDHLAIAWPLERLSGPLIISERDRRHPSLESYMKAKLL